MKHRKVKLLAQGHMFGKWPNQAEPRWNGFRDLGHSHAPQYPAAAAGLNTVLPFLTQLSSRRQTSCLLSASLFVFRI